MALSFDILNSKSHYLKNILGNRPEVPVQLKQVNISSELLPKRQPVVHRTNLNTHIKQFKISNRQTAVGMSRRERNQLLLAPVDQQSVLQTQTPDGWVIEPGDASQMQVAKGERHSKFKEFLDTSYNIGELKNFSPSHFKTMNGKVEVLACDTLVGEHTVKNQNNTMLIKNDSKSPFANQDLL
jgi:hypothetical protein